MDSKHMHDEVPCTSINGNDDISQKKNVRTVRGRERYVG